ncbi:hypothetical protein ACQUW4_003086 [Cronobacter dublinensis]
MPVWLDAVPEKAPFAKRPVTRRWLLLLAIFMLTGAAMTFWNWPSVRAGVYFWFTALGLPLCLWGFIFCLRRIGYKAEQRAICARNAEREILLADEIRRGQRCAWILGSTVETAAGKEAVRLLDVMARALPVPALIAARGGGAAVRYAALSDYQADFSKALDGALARISASVTRVAAQLPPGIPCWLLIDGDEEIAAQVSASAKESLAASTRQHFHTLSGTGTGMAALDRWLDCHWDTPSLLVAITLSFPSAPQNGGADAVTAAILSNRQARAFPDAIQLHRPQKGRPATLTDTLAKALLWSGLPAQSLRGAWVTGPTLIAGAEWNTACEKNGVTFSLTGENTSLDPVLGYAGKASVWLAIAMAQAAFDERGEQVVVAQPVADNDEIWVVVLSRQHGIKETPGNV